jgi:anaerobic selenocysteine-containing dehydrogenase
MLSAVAAFDDSYQRMNQRAQIDIRHSTCPHDCPSACALDIEVIDNSSIGRVRGSKLQTYTAGVVCAKVARYAERIHHPDRLTYPQFRVGPKGSGKFARISWDDALDEVAERFDRAEREFGSESVWPYYYAGTMGLVMKDGINRLTHVKKYSRFYGTICSTIARVGFAAGTGRVAGVDPREMGVSDLVVIWGTNPVNTQVNVMTHASRARKERGAKIAAIDVYNNDTMKQADIKILLRPGTDGAFAWPDQADLLPARLWFYPQPQRRGADARGAVHSRCHRRLATRRRRRVLQQLRDLEIRRIGDRGA